MRRGVRLALALALLAAVVGVAAAAYAVPAVRWRVAVLALKATGELPDISWPELYSMLGPGSRVYLGTLPDTRNPYASIGNPWASPADVAAGEALYRQQCAGCHDAASEGSGAPTLKGRAPKVGSSDWALYRVIREGRPGTAMQPHDYREQDLWQLVAYVQSQIARTGRAVAASSARMPDGGTVRTILFPFTTGVTSSGAGLPVWTAQMSCRRATLSGVISPRREWREPV